MNKANSYRSGFYSLKTSNLGFHHVLSWTLSLYSTDGRANNYYDDIKCHKLL